MPLLRVMVADVRVPALKRKEKVRVDRIASRARIAIYAMPDWDE
jgi:hypothetical protein